jgi:aspartyl-tRNA(Asn)/glutamyl-tRNA(Gln) amidotransferase subunit C
MALTTDEVRHIALLARVGMTDEDVEVMRDELSDILDHFEVLQQADTEGVEPRAHSADMTSVMRDDEIRECLPIDDALANAPTREGDFVRVRAVLD